MTAISRIGEYNEKIQKDTFRNAYAYETSKIVKAALCLWDAFISEAGISMDILVAFNNSGTEKIRNFLTKEEPLNSMLWYWECLNANDPDVECLSVKDMKHMTYANFDFPREFLRTFFIFSENGVAKNPFFPQNFENILKKKHDEYWDNNKK